MSRMVTTNVRRDWGSDDTGATILHVDMDAFFASVEVLDNPKLLGKPVIVAGGSRGVVSAASYEARATGVHSAMPTAQARRLCPDGIFLQGRHGRYSEVSREVMAVLESITPLVEPVSIDEAFLDVSGALLRLGSPVEIAQLIRERIRAEVGVPASVGVAGSKHVAKMASGFAKPDGFMLVPVAQTEQFLLSLPVRALWGVGPATAEQLARRGVTTVAQLLEVPAQSVARWLGPALAAHILRLAAGHDERAVSPGRVEQSISTETTFPENVANRSDLDRVILAQAHECGAKLRRGGHECTRVAIKVRFADFATITRSRTLAAPTYLGAAIAAAARELLAQVEIPRAGLRLIGVRVDGLVTAATVGVQETLDTAADRVAAEQAMDAVRRRFGEHTVRPGSLLDSPPVE